jgi:hypothetical protein
MGSKRVCVATGSKDVSEQPIDWQNCAVWTSYLSPKIQKTRGLSPRFPPVFCLFTIGGSAPGASCLVLGLGDLSAFAVNLIPNDSQEDTVAQLGPPSGVVVSAISTRVGNIFKVSLVHTND